MHTKDPLPAIKHWESHSVQRLLKRLRSPWMLRLYFLRHLPSAFFWRMRLLSLQPEGCSVQLPFSWRTQNPFRSIYFAAQCAAAELSTGLPAAVAVEGRTPSVSMLLTHVETEFHKKAATATTFTCEDGLEVLRVVQQALDTGEAQTITMTSTGRDAQGDIVSRSRLTWSFKARAK